MRSFSVHFSLAVILLTGCGTTGTSDLSKSGTGNSNNDGAPAYANRAKPNGDFSTPKAAVTTFIAAAKNKDAVLLSQCFHPNSPGEFRKLRERSSSAKELDDLANFVLGAEIGEVKESGDTALVKVAFKERNEEMSIKKSEGEWKIFDF